MVDAEVPADTHPARCRPATALHPRRYTFRTAHQIKLICYYFPDMFHLDHYIKPKEVYLSCLNIQMILFIPFVVLARNVINYLN